VRRFSLADPDFEIPPIHHLELEWAGASHTDLARQIGFQDQFRQFFRYLLGNLQSCPTKSPEWSPQSLSLSLRAGAIRTYMLLSVSIAEGALAALGEERKLGKKPGELYQRTFGSLLAAWEKNGQPRSEVEVIWPELQTLKRYRNYVHLSRAATDEEAYWKEILEKEQELLDAADAVVSHLRDLCHVFRDT
jgi:hypothetical protein